MERDAGFVVNHMIGEQFDLLLSSTEMGRLALCCHFSLDILCHELHNTALCYSEVVACTGRD